MKALKRVLAAIGFRSASPGAATPGKAAARPGLAAGGRRPFWLAYGLPFITTAVTLWVIDAAGPDVPIKTPVIVFLLPIILSAYVGGLAPGLLSTVLCTLTTFYFVLPPTHTWRVENPVDNIKWITLAGAGILISFLMAHRERPRPEPVAQHSRQAAGSLLSTERKVRAGFAVLLASLIAIAAVSYPALVRLRQDTAWVDHSHRVIATLRLLISSTTDAETNVRGYVITGREEFLEPYRSAVQRANQALSEVRRLTKDNPEQQQRLDMLEPLVAERVTLLKEGIERGHQAFLLAPGSVSRGRGPQVQEQIRGAVAEMEATEEALLAKREALEERASVVAKIEIVGGSALAVLIVAAALWMIGKAFTASRGAETALEESRDQLEIRVKERTSELLQERDRLSALLNSISDEVWFADTEKGFTLVNRAGLREFGYDSISSIDVEALAKNLEVYRADGSARPVEEAPPLRALNGEVVKDQEEIVRTPATGDLRYRQVSAAPVKDAAGNIIGSVSVVRDITERKRAQEALRESENRLRTVLDNSRDVIVRSNLQTGRYEYVSPSVEALVGYTPEMFIALSFDDEAVRAMVHPEDLPELLAAWAHAEETGEAEVEYRQRKKNGEYVWIANRMSVTRDSAGRPLYRTGSLRDITERKRAEQEREISVEFLRLVNASTGIHELVKAAATFFQEQSGCQAIGIRLRDGEDYPYCEARGFPKQFVLMENSLCARNPAGQVIRDTAGYPIHDCMCGNVIHGRFDPAKPFFTAHGSFWTNCTTELLASTTEADRQSRTRNRCNGEGYESVALIPLQAGQERLGLLQLNDPRKGQFSAESITLWESLAGYLGVALAKTMAQEALHESENQFRTLANAIPTLCWMANADGWITWYNERWYEYTGTTPEQMEGWGWQSVHDPEALPEVLERWKASIATRKPFEMIFPLRGADGVFRPFLTRIIPLFDGDGQVVRWFGTNTDITEQRRIEEALRESEAKAKAQAAELAALMEAVPVGIFRSYDTECRWMEGNRAAYELLRRPRGSNLSKFGPEGEKPLNFRAMKDGKEIPLSELWMQKAAATGQAVRDHEMDLVFEDGVTVSIMGNVEPLLDESGRPRGVVGAFLDVTELKRAEEALAQRVQELARSNADLEQFAYVASHDLKEPLRAVSGCLGLLQRHYEGKLDDFAGVCIKHAVDGALRMESLIDGLLAYSRVGVRGREFETVECAKVLDAALQNLAAAIQGSGAVVTHDPLPAVHGDAPQLVSLFQNLISNALKFRKEAPPLIHVSAERNGADWRFSVRDNGVGIAPQFFGRIFGVFQRLHTRSQYPGTGIGLALCKKIVERHGGRIWVESVPGEGSTFCFSLVDAQTNHPQQERKLHAEGRDAA